MNLATPTGPSSADPPILALVVDLIFATRISDEIRRQGGRPLLAATQAEFRARLARWPVLILLDLQALPPEAWQLEVRRAKASPQSRLIPIVAFGSHVDTEALKAAREAGCDHVMARSGFVQKLPRLVAEGINPAPAYPDGWDDQPADLFLQGIELFNAGQFYQQHDIFEAHWTADQRSIRDLYQGIPQIGVAFDHIEQGNYRGAVKTLRRGLLRLRLLPPVCQTLDVAALRRAARRIHDELLELGPDRLADFDLARLRQIKLMLVDA